MSFRRPLWLGALVGAGRAFVEVLKAEVEGLQRDLSRSSRQLIKALVLLGIAVVLVGWVLGLLATALIAFLQSTGVFSVWQATLLVAGALAVLAIGLALWARGIVRRIEPPTQTVGRRLGNHFDWAQGQLGAEDTPSGGKAGDGRS